jgi:chemotaxis protein MotB
MIAAFRSPTKSIMPIQIGNIVKSPSGTAVELPPMAQNRTIEPTRRTPRSGHGAEGTSAQEALHQVANDLAKAFEPLIAEDLVSLREGRLWLELEIRSAVLFDSGRAEVRRDAVPVVDRVVDILRGVPNSVRVEGYTDDRPIHSAEFRSNWDLSAARAGSMVHHLLERGIDPLRLSLAGYGEYRPVADNASEDGRVRNRRVVLVVLATPDAVAQREIENSITPVRQPPATALPLPLPPGVPSALSIVSDSARPAEPAVMPIEPPRGEARWPADRIVGGAPSFIQPPPLPQIAPAL